MVTMDEVLDVKEELEYSQKEYELARKQQEQAYEYMLEKQQEFRTKEVKYVLDTLLTKNRSEGGLSQDNIDIYLNHCLNCLAGNIDGCVVDLSNLFEN